MALVKNIDTDFGVPACYWNIGAYSEGFRTKSGFAIVYGYTDAAARISGKQPLTAVQITFESDDYVADMTREDIYALVKQRPEFDGAEDA